jgi:hypothetical protein
MYVILLLFQDLTAEMKLEDFTGKSLLAIEVFGLSIQALKSHMMNALEKEGTKIKPHDDNNISFFFLKVNTKFLIFQILLSYIKLLF